MKDRNGKGARALHPWNSREAALRVAEAQMLGTWTARLHVTGKGWLLQAENGRTFDQLGPIDGGPIGEAAASPAPLIESDYRRDGDVADPDVVHISFDNSTGVHVRVERHYDKRGGCTVDATFSCPPLGINASVAEVRELAQTLLVAAEEAQRLLKTVNGGLQMANDTDLD